MVLFILGGSATQGAESLLTFIVSGGVMVGLGHRLPPSSQQILEIRAKRAQQAWRLEPKGF